MFKLCLLLGLSAVADAKLFSRFEKNLHGAQVKPTATYTDEWKCRHEDGSFSEEDHNPCEGASEDGCEFVGMSCRQVPKQSENNSDAPFICKQKNATDDNSEYTDHYGVYQDELFYDQNLCDPKIYGDLCEWGAIKCRSRPEEERHPPTYPEESDAADDVENNEHAAGDIAPEQGAGDDRRKKHRVSKSAKKSVAAHKAAKKASKRAQGKKF